VLALKGNAPSAMKESGHGGDLATFVRRSTLDAYATSAAKWAGTVPVPTKARCLTTLGPTALAFWSFRQRMGRGDMRQG
jgi:hypothetical protein